MAALPALRLLAALAGSGGVALAAGLFQPPAAAWQEIAWPFPPDAWPPGRAFRCSATSCGGEQDVYVRPKLGFCANCATGVTADSEVDGVSDLDMISADFVPDAAGTPVQVGDMAGRTRRYTLILPGGTRRAAAGWAMSRRCDLVVAASQGRAAGSPAAQTAIAALLQTPPVLAWIQSQI